LNGLSPVLRDAFRSHYVDGLSTRERPVFWASPTVR
jgi:hypothetical protein